MIAAIITLSTVSYVILGLFVARSYYGWQRAGFIDENVSKGHSLADVREMWDTKKPGAVSEALLGIGLLWPLIIGVLALGVGLAKAVTWKPEKADAELRAEEEERKERRATLETQAEAAWDASYILTEPEGKTDVQAQP